MTVLSNYVVCVCHGASDGDRICTGTWHATVL